MGERLPWQQLLQSAIASHSHLGHHRFCQLATVRPNGTPANRTVVFRGFIEGTDNLFFTTDSRTNKVEDAQHCPLAELCYYFTESWEQFRIHGQMEVIGYKETDEHKRLLREKTWFNSSLKSRCQFLGAHPGHPIGAHPSGEVKLDPSQGPVDTFCIVTLHPSEVDYYHLKEQQRTIYRRVDGIWVQQEVNP